MSALRYIGLPHTPAAIGPQHPGREPPSACSIPAESPPTTLVTRAAKGVVCDTISQQPRSRMPAAKLDGEESDRIVVPPSVCTIPAGGLPPNLVTRAAKDILSVTIGQQHPRREAANGLAGEGRRQY